ncbi:MAG: heavy metal-responsive transcriptional regulator [Xanthomonadaceae bacterium]|nr:heavy metal-responsive transcriptional regulator [Xanthomonadaceae bacterium]MDE2278174.1 heavy metal-responsive transcriptional regulator [Xanthomonadaceae bacterium]MDE2316550.1 heavy metal-responsive transcriptional regulator [Xanthomonadaceae bacterium]
MSFPIGAAANKVGMSTDTLRYYERIGLMRPTLRDTGGRRVYTERELEQLRFIARAQAMDFRLAEIRRLLELRNDPSTSRNEARRLTRSKLAEIDRRMRDLKHLRDELRLLLNLCDASADTCPILQPVPDGSTRKCKA